MRRRLVDLFAYTRVPKESYKAVRGKLESLNVPPYGDINFVVARPWPPIESLPLTIIYCHGRDETIPLIESLTQTYANYFCANVLFFDYFGYGETQGQPSEASTNAAMLALVCEAKRRFPDSKTIAWGRSIGSCAACFAIDLVDMCVVESGLSSAARTVFTTNKLFCLDGFNNSDRIAQGTTPTFIIHGTDDEVVPYRCSVENYNRSVETRFSRCKSEIYFDPDSKNQLLQCGNVAHLSIFGRGHNDLNTNDASKAIMFQLRDFIAQHLKLEVSRCKMANTTVKRPREAGKRIVTRALVE